MLSMNQVVRLLKIFSYSQHLNHNRHSIIEKLVKIIDSKIEELDEQDVINLLKSYQYLPSDIPRSNILFNKLNQMVKDQAL